MRACEGGGLATERLVAGVGGERWQNSESGNGAGLSQSSAAGSE